MPDVLKFTTAEASGDLLMAIRRLLAQAFGGDFSEEDWEHTLGGWHVVVADGGAALTHVAVVPRVLEVADRPLNAGYVEGVGTAPERQREGLGSVAMAEASELIRGEFEMGALSTGYHKFYAAFGWERWLGPTYVRRGSAAVRTEEEDDGVMVLRFGPSKDLDPTASLSCEGRRGDDW
ncbi:MAG: GNAT family N-acetyltransferase [Actinomycetota bacterium]|nr:GNAT family N-acetyltransferase [Actinomycetota bacterium]